MSIIDKVPAGKKVIFFDLDGTLTKSRTPMDEEMKGLFLSLLAKYKVSVISGGLKSQFDKQLLIPLGESGSLGNLHILPANGTTYLTYDKGWNAIFDDRLSEDEKAKITAAAYDTIKSCGLQSIFDEKKGLIQDKGGQVSLSIYNPDWPVDEKMTWDPTYEKRREPREYLQKLLPDFEVKIGGTTTLDITRKGIDKGFAVHRTLSFLKLKPEDAFFCGDAVFEGGNDHAAVEVIDGMQVSGPEQTKKVIRQLIN